MLTCKLEFLFHLIFLSILVFKSIRFNLIQGPRKYIWLIALVLAVTLVVILFRSTMSDYLNYKTYIETEYDSEKQSLPFPTVTICFSDNFVPSKFKKFPGNVTMEQYKRIFNVLHMDVKATKEDVALVESLNVSSYETLIRGFHLTLEDTVLHETSLIFNRGKACSFSKQSCTMDDLKLVWRYSGQHSCLQFNSYHPNKTPREQSVIFSPFRVYLDVRAKFNKDFFAPDMYRYHRMTLNVHPWGIPHEIHMGKSRNTVLIDKKQLQPGGKHQFYMDHHVINNLESPYGTCGEKKLKVVRYYPYSINSCILDCMLQYVIAECGCVRFDLKYAVDEGRGSIMFDFYLFSNVFNPI